jgi:hypothetical protein
MDQSEAAGNDALVENELRDLEELELQAGRVKRKTR